MVNFERNTASKRTLLLTNKESFQFYASFMFHRKFNFKYNNFKYL